MAWDEIRTAYHVASAGTVSGAAEALGVHHATVIRHVDALEARLGVKLFHRHARGYAVTDAGEELRLVAQVTDDQFAQLSGRLKDRGAAVAGDLVVTTVPGLEAWLVPVLTDLGETYPDVAVRVVTEERLLRLDYGEAHVAIRAGAKPAEPDNVVRPFGMLTHGLYASEGYAARHGVPADEGALAAHRFVCHDDPDHRAPFYRWLRQNVSRDRIVFRSSDPHSLYGAIRSGAGIGFMPGLAAGSGAPVGEVLPARPEWSVPLWLVTHVDLHRTAKVQAILSALRSAGEPMGPGGAGA